MDKKCRVCGEDKPIESFPADPRYAGGRKHECRSCETRRVASSRAKDPERARTMNREYSRTPQRRESIEAYRITESGKMAASKAKSNERLNSPEKIKARNAVNNALRRGDIVKQACEVCGDEDAHAHHDDYSKPLDIRWLCVTHHHEHHVAQRNELAAKS